jgi:hypothetical protein
MLKIPLESFEDLKLRKKFYSKDLIYWLKSPNPRDKYTED